MYFIRLSNFRIIPNDRNNEIITKNLYIKKHGCWEEKQSSILKTVQYTESTIQCNQSPEAELNMNRVVARWNSEEMFFQRAGAGTEKTCFLDPIR